jgi:O-antigen/teichoic acid export membrane protein
MSFYNRIDSVMIERILPDSISNLETGIYASAFRLLDSLAMISYLFSVILLPLFSKMIKDKEDINPIIKTSFSLLFYFAITSVVLLINYRFTILDFLYNEHVKESADVFIILIPCIIPISFAYIFGTLLTANGNMKLLNIVAIAGIIVNVIINLVLIPELHARGAAIASLSTQSVVSLLQIIIVFKELKIPFSNIPFLKCLLFCILLIPSIYIIAHLQNFNSFIGLLIGGIISLLLAFITRLIPLTFLRDLKLKKN